MRPDILNPLFAPVSSFHGIGPKLFQWIQNLCGGRVIDVLRHFPCNLNQRPILKNIPTSPVLATLQVTITEHKIPYKKKQPHIVFGSSNLGQVQLVFFHYHTSFLTQKLAIDSQVWVSGQCIAENNYIKILHPDYIEKDLSKIPKHEAVYPLKAGASGKVIRHLIEQILPTLVDLPEEIDPQLIQKNNWPSWKQALHELHSPQKIEDLDPYSPARTRLAFDELLANQTALHLIRQHNKNQAGISLPFLNKYILNLPFKLTKAQEKCLSVIRQDLQSSQRMTRLLQGDVGSGKTIVALLAALQAVENNYQAVFLAPTDILARQHFNKIKTLCTPLNITVELLTAKEKGKKHTQILENLANGSIHILIGTHAILEEKVLFHHLGFVIIDEQHRFGVKQRLFLTQKQPGVNVLVMSATPIPRTLALTAYGDMDISLLDEKPVGRQPIDTRVLALSQIQSLLSKLQTIQKQIYWVCPLIEESEKSDLMAAEKRYQDLQKIFGSNVGLIHGKMKNQEKEKVMDNFIKGKIKILVSTTVIEVGVDVPSASLMIVEHAERFGLATLHQLRGRVGRGQEKAVCLLLYGHLSSMAKERLTILRQSDNGFKIAEADLRLRGAGEVLGTRQSGLPSFFFADLTQHSDLLQLANEQADLLLKEDPSLETKRGQALKNMLYLFEKDKEIHSLKA